LSRISKTLGIFKWIQAVKYFRGRDFLKRVVAWTATASALPVPPIIGGTAGLASESENR
jgi:hypothetical protein